MKAKIRVLIKAIEVIEERSENQLDKGSDKSFVNCGPPIYQRMEREAFKVNGTGERQETEGQRSDKEKFKCETCAREFDSFVERDLHTLDAHFATFICKKCARPIYGFYEKNHVCS